jgi:hypothetical protein
LSPFPSDIFINKKKKENNSLAKHFLFPGAFSTGVTSCDVHELTTFPSIEVSF